MSLTRRDVLKKSITSIGAIVGLGVLGKAFAATCGLTPAQTEGPFYPEQDQADKNADLTWVDSLSQKALGQVIYIEGTVQDTACNPIEGALVEIWQACASGRYNHSGDTNTAALDKNFQYWGQVVTNADGRYLFKTVLPGAYPASQTWWRPPHIHYKVAKVGFHELTTQLYFAGQALNAQDSILQGLPASEQKKVVVALKPTAPPLQAGTQIAKFDIALSKLPYKSVGNV